MRAREQRPALLVHLIDWPEHPDPVLWGSDAGLEAHGLFQA